MKIVKMTMCLTILSAWSIWAQETPKSDPAKPAGQEKEAPKEAVKPQEPQKAQDALKPEEVIKKDIEEAIKKLASDKYIESEEARAELLELGRRTVPDLIRALNSDKPAVRRVVCDLLGELRDPDAVPPLMHRLLDPEEYGASIASSAARALGLIGDPRAVPELVKLLDSTRAKTDKDLRYELIRALGAMRAREAIEPLKKLVDDRERTPFSQMIIGCAAVEALAKLRAQEAVPAIGKLLNEPTAESGTGMTVELYAARALERITGVTHGPLFDANDEKTKEALKKWKEWWAGEKKKIDLAENKSKIETTRTTIEKAVVSIEQFKLDHNAYPKKLEDLVTRPEYVPAEKWPKDGYWKTMPKDGWDRAFIYRIPGMPGHPYDLVSHGLDGKEGGDGADGDLWDHNRDMKKEGPKKEDPKKIEPPKKDQPDGKK